MKFLKFSLLTAVLLSVVFAFSSCGDDDDTGYLPPSQAIQDALKKLYPNATAIKWEQKGVLLRSRLSGGRQREGSLVRCQCQLADDGNRVEQYQ